MTWPLDPDEVEYAREEARSNPEPRPDAGAAFRAYLQRESLGQAHRRLMAGRGWCPVHRVPVTPDGPCPVAGCDVDLPF